MPGIRNDGVRISYDVAGEGWPLVLLHGWCCDRSWWTEPGYVEELRRDHLLVVVDLRGHGASDKPHGPPALNGSRRWCPRDRGTRDPFTKSRRSPTSGTRPSGTVGRARWSTCLKNEDGAAARAAVQQARGFPTLATPGPALIA